MAKTTDRFPPPPNADSILFVKDEAALAADAKAFIESVAPQSDLPPGHKAALKEGRIRRRADIATERDEATPPDKREVYPDPIPSSELATIVYPPVVWPIDMLIRADRPQTLDGDGGIGKSVVSVGMSVARSAGVPIFGFKTIPGPCLFITHEDDADDLQAMAKAYATYLKVNLADLPLDWWPLLENDICLATVDDRGGWEKGPFYDTLESRLKPGLFVVLDCRSDVVQMSEHLREPPNTFYKTILTPLCKKYHCAILVLCHPSKAGIADGSMYSGGTGNKSALRNKLVMKLEDPKNEDGPRLFGVLKRNRGKRRNLIRLSFDVEREIYVADDDAAVQEGQRETFELVIAAVLELVALPGVRVMRSGKGDGRSPKDVADYINREKKPEKSITGKVVADMLKLAEETGRLVYQEAFGKLKATYKAPSQADFEE